MPPPPPPPPGAQTCPFCCPQTSAETSPLSPLSFTVLDAAPPQSGPNAERLYAAMEVLAVRCLVQVDPGWVPSHAPPERFPDPTDPLSSAAPVIPVVTTAPEVLAVVRALLPEALASTYFETALVVVNKMLNRYRSLPCTPSLLCVCVCVDLLTVYLLYYRKAPSRMLFHSFFYFYGLTRLVSDQCSALSVCLFVSLQLCVFVCVCVWNAVGLSSGFLVRGSRGQGQG